MLLDTTLYSRCNQTSDLWQKLELASEVESDLQDIVDWGRKLLVDWNAGKTCLTGLIMLVLLLSKLMGRFLKKNHLVKCWDCLYLPNWSPWNSYIVFITKTAYKKIVALICLLTFFVLKVLFISKSLPFDLPWNTVVIFEQVVLVAPWCAR